MVYIINICINANISDMGFIDLTRNGVEKNLVFSIFSKSVFRIPLGEVIMETVYLSLGSLKRRFSVEVWAPPSSGLVIT